jgi:hypothetical protein
MGTTRHFHVVFDVRVLDLNLSNEDLRPARTDFPIYIDGQDILTRNLVPQARMG